MTGRAMAETAKVERTDRRPPTYRAHLPILWWMRRRSYLLFVVRELSSVFVAWFVVFLLLLVAAVARGDEAYRRFLDWSANPVVLGVNVVAVLFVVYHALTWFNLAPKAMIVNVRGRRLPPMLVAIAHFGAWVVVSAVVAWIVLG
jgi:fumarate reductase subunit C